jgi:hypothetical protein
MGRPTMASTASTLEIAWTLIAVVSLGFTAWIIDDNVRNYAAIRTAVQRGQGIAWGPRWWVAVASLVSSAAMFVVWLGFATVGVLAMTAGPETNIDYRMWVSGLSSWVLVAMTLILAGIQVWQVFARTKIRPINPKPGQPPQPEDIRVASDQTRYAADLVDALRPSVDVPESDDKTERTP